MPFNGSGTFSLSTAGQPVVTETVASSTMFNAVLTELEVGLSTCITKDGQTTTTGTIPIASLQVDAIVNDTGLAAGTYAPTVTGVTNIDSASAPGVWKYSRVGNVVTASGPLTISTTAAAGTSTVVAISLPIASDLADAYDLNGTANSFIDHAIVQGDGTNNRASLAFLSSSATPNIGWHAIFQYEVI